jgi:DNA-binding transcriptional MerR regulator
MPIGRFARTCRLSVKALRHYDELGLLRPARVDVATGYRYYDRAQARAAIAIAMLRSLGVPLPTIRELLVADDPAAIARILGGERNRIGRELVRAREALVSIERIIRDGSVMPYTTSTRTEPARRVLMVEATTAAERHVEATFALVATLDERLRTLGHSLASPVMCLLPDPPDDDLVTLQVCAPIPDRLRKGGAGATVVELPAGPAAVVVHRGSYEELGLAQHALFAWVQERGHEPAGPVRELYLNDPATVAAADLVTEVVLPLRRDTPRAAAERR